MNQDPGEVRPETPLQGTAPWALDPLRVRKDECWIYFIQAEHGGPIKIGSATTADGRLAALQVGSPYKLVLRRAVRGLRDDETRLHALFAEHRLHGEWFKPVPELVALADGVADDPLNTLEQDRTRRKRPPGNGALYARYQDIIREQKAAAAKREAERRRTS